MNKNFKDLGISDILISALEKQSVNEPTEVQINTIPEIL